MSEKWYLTYFEVLSMKWNEISNILSRKHDHKCASEWFKIKKKQMKSKNYEIYQYLVISYVEAIVKIWESFEHFVTYDAYKSKHLKERLVALRMIFNQILRQPDDQVVVWLQNFLYRQQRT